MKIQIEELREKANTYLKLSGLNDKDASTLDDLIIEQELVGNQFSAVVELPGKHSRLIDRMKVLPRSQGARLILENACSLSLSCKTFTDLLYRTHN